MRGDKRDVVDAFNNSGLTPAPIELGYQTRGQGEPDPAALQFWTLGA
jgi:hypothetical protein